MSAMTHENLLQSVRHGMTALTLTLTLKYQCHHYHFPINLPEMVKEGGLDDSESEESAV